MNRSCCERSEDYSIAYRIASTLACKKGSKKNQHQQMKRVVYWVLIFVGVRLPFVVNMKYWNAYDTLHIN